MYLGKSGVGEGVIVGATVAVGDSGEGKGPGVSTAGGELVVVGAGVRVGRVCNVVEAAAVGKVVCGRVALSSASSA